MKRFGLLSLVWVAVLFVFPGIVTAQKLPRIFPRKVQHEKNEHMSAMGRLAARVNTVLQQKGIVTARALTTPPNPTGDKGCTNAPDCFDDVKGPPGGEAETSMAGDTIGQHGV